MDPQEKLRLDIKHFLEVYRFMTAEAKAHFEAQLAGELKGKDPKTKGLYYALVQAAKEGRGIEAAIAKLTEAA